MDWPLMDTTMTALLASGVAVVGLIAFATMAGVLRPRMKKAKQALLDEPASRREVGDMDLANEKRFEKLERAIRQIRDDRPGLLARIFGARDTAALQGVMVAVGEAHQESAKTIDSLRAELSETRLLAQRLNDHSAVLETEVTKLKQQLAEAKSDAKREREKRDKDREAERAEREAERRRKIETEERRRKDSEQHWGGAPYLREVF